MPRHITYTGLMRVQPLMRFVYGPSHEKFVVAGDVAVTLDKVERVDGVVTVTVLVPPHDLASSSKLLKVFAVCSPSAPGAGVQPEDFVNAPGNFVGAMEAVGDGTEVQVMPIPVPNVTPGGWFVQTVLVFEE